MVRVATGFVGQAPVNFKARARLAALMICLALPGAPAAAQLPHWPTLSWGMTTAELDQALGPELAVLPGRWIYGQAYAERAQFHVDLDGLSFTAYFQMNDQSERLQQILLERRDIGADPRSVDETLTRLEARYGRPAEQCLRLGPDGAVMAADLVWRLAEATLHASFLDFRTSGVLYYDPTVDLDPKVPSFETRRINRRSLPRRLTLRLHPPDRADLERPVGCTALKESDGSVGPEQP